MGDKPEHPHGAPPGQSEEGKPGEAEGHTGAPGQDKPEPNQDLPDEGEEAEVEE